MVMLTILSGGDDGGSWHVGKIFTNKWVQISIKLQLNLSFKLANILSVNQNKRK